MANPPYEVAAALIVSHVKLGELHQHDVVSRTEARNHYADALAIAEALHGANRLAPADLWMIDDLKARLASRSASAGAR